VKSELIIFLLIVLGNGAVALWKKWKERQAAQPAPQAPAARVPPPAPRVRERPDRRAEVERLRERARAKARAADPAPAPLPRVVTQVAVAPPSVPVRARPVASVPSAPLPVLGLDRRSLRQAMLLHEILGPPRSVRPHG
jgi:hypothetical protein